MFQLRYAGQAGVPPVDYGVLYYFNLTETDSGDERSVYERAARGARDGEDLFEIVTDINRHSNHHIRNLIFFDLNHDNLTRYDRNVFRETLARFN
jgi:hypothetical protein